MPRTSRPFDKEWSALINAVENHFTLLKVHDSSSEEAKDSFSILLGKINVCIDAVAIRAQGNKSAELSAMLQIRSKLDSREKLLGNVNVQRVLREYLRRVWQPHRLDTKYSS